MTQTPPNPQTAIVDSSSSASPRPLREPARRLTPGPGQRRLRRLLAALGVTVIVLAVGALSLSSFISWRTAQAFPLHETRTGLGLPSSLEVDVDLGGVTVLPSTEVSEVTIGMAPAGARSFTAGQDEARARVETTGGSAARVTVTQPRYSGSADAFRASSPTLLVLVPDGHALDLQVNADIGEVEIEGEHASITASVDVGDLDITLPENATSAITAQVEVGDLRITAPGTQRYDVTTAVDVGDVTVDETMRAAPGQDATRISARVSTGQISVSR
ncbi:DUF4097 family beta strand repeat-containing protein [Brachybacterium timonense]|uniref:DUF4097 family beta strand repeat-containing protein n=1 Tax=Brachybacterium timonense TaxID=2050896 RepID=UPI00110DB518|nr:DUF4097 family beta strand repeat-containing protein [Brachybacterium timonense]